MARKRMKQFPKKQLLSLVKQGKYQKVISKIKQFEITEINENELNSILIDSYRNLAQEHFNNSSWARVIREIDNAIALESHPEIKLEKLKYLCYMEHFQDAITLGEELINVKEIKKEATFLYLLAKFYHHEFEFDTKHLKILPKAKANYLMGLLNLMQDKKESALEYFNKIRPRAKDEKENMKLLRAIMTHETVEIPNTQGLKALYLFLLTGNEAQLLKTKNSREGIKELKKLFTQEDRSTKLKSLLELKSPIDNNLIHKEIKDRELRAKLTYNNVLLLHEQRDSFKALELFLQNRDEMIQFIESAPLFLNIKNSLHANNFTDVLFVNWLSRYIERYHHKIASSQLDLILLEMIMQSSNPKNVLSIAQKYNRDHFILILVDLLDRENVERNNLQERFNTFFRRYSIINSKLLTILSKNIENIDLKLSLEGNTNSEKKKEHLYNTKINLLLELIENLDRPNRRYQNELIELLRVLSILIQSFNYQKYENAYLELSKIIQDHVKHFNINRFDLAIDIKALFISISKKHSIKQDNFYDSYENEFDTEDERIRQMRRELFGFYMEEEKYDFNEKEYDIVLIKEVCIEALERGEKNPFKNLSKLTESYHYRNFIYAVLLDLLEFIETLDNHQKDTKSLMDEMLEAMSISLYEETNLRSLLVSELRKRTKHNIILTQSFYEYALESVPKTKKESVWYLKWIDGYLNFIDKNKLEKGTDFKKYLDFFVKTQKKNKFKTINSKFNTIVKKFIN